MEGAIARQSPTERTQAMRISRIQRKKAEMEVKVKMKVIRRTVISQRMVTKVSQSSPRQS